MEARSCPVFVRFGAAVDVITTFSEMDLRERRLLTKKTIRMY
jgi:hypothetical protein